MSGFNFTTTELLADIKRKSFVPISQITFSDDDLLAMADEEIQTGIVPFIMSVREEYFVDYVDYIVDENTRTYPIPARTIGAKLRMVTVLINPENNQQPNERRLPEIDAAESIFNNNFNNFLSLQAFFLRDNSVVLSPSANSFAGQTLRLTYFKRPNKLIPVSSCSQLTGTVASNQAVVNIVPTNFGTGSSVTITADLVKATDPFDLLAMDIPITIDTSTNVATFPADLSTYNINVGDYICLAGESPIAILPFEAQSLLAQRVAVKILQALGDAKNFQLATTRLQEMEHNIKAMLSNRVEGSNRKVVNHYNTFNVNPFRRF